MDKPRRQVSGMKATPASRLPTTIAAFVFDAVRTGILDGRYAVGSKLDQQGLADEFGASHIPIREALRQLEAEGLVRISPRKGAFVSELSMGELQEIYSVRQLLEGHATRLAVPNMNRVRVRTLRDLVDRMAQVNDLQDHGNWQELNRQFHFAVYDRAGSPLLLELVRSLWDRSSLFRDHYARQEAHRSHSQAGHMAIIQACSRGDPDAAVKATVDHIRDAASQFESDEADHADR